MLIPKDVVIGEGASAVVHIEELVGIATRAAHVELFDNDFYRWLDPPSDSGTLRY